MIGAQTINSSWVGLFAWYYSLLFIDSHLYLYLFHGITRITDYGRDYHTIKAKGTITAPNIVGNFIAYIVVFCTWKLKGTLYMIHNI